MQILIHSVRKPVKGKDMANQKSFTTEYRRYNLPVQFPVLLLSGHYWKISDIPSGKLHFHNCLEIGLCHSENGTMEFYKKPLPFQSGDVTVVPRNVPHTTYSAPGKASHWSYVYLNPQELFEGLLPSSWENCGLSLSVTDDFQYILSREKYPKIHYLLTLAIQELAEKRPVYQISAKGLLLALYTELCRIENDVEKYPPPVKNSAKRTIREDVLNSPLTIAPALDYIEDNYMQQFSIDYLASLCHWSPTHFRRVFHTIMGTSPLNYVNNVKIMKSCSLLVSTGHSILDISEMVGFRSVSNYNRYFMRIMKMSPREYRKLQRSDKQDETQAVPEYAG